MISLIWHRVPCNHDNVKIQYGTLNSELQSDPDPTAGSMEDRIHYLTEDYLSST
jgi:hypothetical protein